MLFIKTRRRNREFKCIERVRGRLFFLSMLTVRVVGLEYS